MMIWGDHDPVVPLQAARHAAQLIPRARLEVLLAGHVPQLGQPRRVTELITEVAQVPAWWAKGSGSR
jgi:pimeloyl-ACP methyl ester carboxylesterase